jgi:hypothetical protein
MSRFCENCGSELKSEASFCEHCGAALKIDEFQKIAKEEEKEGKETKTKTKTKKPKKKKKILKAIIIIIVVIIIMFIVLIIGIGVLVGTDNFRELEGTWVGTLKDSGNVEIPLTFEFIHGDATSRGYMYYDSFGNPEIHGDTNSHQLNGVITSENGNSLITGTVEDDVFEGVMEINGIEIGNFVAQKVNENLSYYHYYDDLTLEEYLPNSGLSLKTISVIDKDIEPVYYELLTEQAEDFILQNIYDLVNDLYIGEAGYRIEEDRLIYMTEEGETPILMSPIEVGTKWEHEELKYEIVEIYDEYQIGDYWFTQVVVVDDGYNQYYFAPHYGYIEIRNHEYDDFYYLLIEVN